MAKRYFKINILILWLIILTGFIVLPEFVNAAANLGYDSLNWTQYSGNGDNVINRGEKIYLRPVIRNSGTSRTDGVYAYLTTTSQYVTFSYTPQSSYQMGYGTINAGATGTTSSSYGLVTFADNTPPGTVITFTLNINDTYGNTWTSNFNVTVEATGANLGYDSLNWTQYSGNGDNVINRGEKIYLRPVIRNSGTSGTDGIYAYLTTTSQYVTFSYTPQSSYQMGYGTIGAGATGTTSSSYGLVTFADNAYIEGTLILFTLNINDAYGNAWADSFTIKMAGPPITPSGFSGVAQSPTSILWTWIDNSDDESGFIIRDEKNNTIASLPANTNSWLETGLSPNTRYTRYVNAYNSYGSRDSNSASVYTLVNPPLNLSANGNLIEDCIALYWDGNKGSRFAIERALDINGFPGSWQTIKSWNDNIVSETFIDTGLTPNTKYWYRVKGYNGDGIINDTPTNEVSAVTLPGKVVSSPKVVLYNNLIDPAKNQTVYIRCDLPQEDNVTVSVYDLAGRKVKTIIDNEKKPAGINIIEWAGKNVDNEIVASGSYIVYIKAGNFVDKKKVLVIK